MSTERNRPKPIIAILLVILAVLGIVILSLDQVLWKAAAAHRAYPLIGFVIINLVLAALVFAKRLGFSPVLIWSALSLTLNLGDVATAPQLLEGAPTSAAFASYLFNPFYTPPVGVFANPAGIPAVPLDLMVIIYVILVALSIRGLRQARKAAQ